MITLNLTVFNVRYLHSRFGVVLANLLLALSFFLTFVSKEHGIVVGPAAFLLHLAPTSAQGRDEFLAQLKKVILPIGFGCFYSVLFVQRIVMPLLGPAAETISANPWTNLQFFLSFATNYNILESTNGVYIVATIFLLGLIVCLLGLVKVYRHSKLSSELSLKLRLLIWAASAFLLIMTAIARIHNQDDYYLFVPSLFFYSFIALLFQGWTELIKQELAHLTMRKVSQFVAVTLLLLMGVNHFYHYPRRPLEIPPVDRT